MTGWIEKNRDMLTPSLVSILRESKNGLIRYLFSTSETETGALVSHDTSGRVQQRQDNAREMMAVLRRSIWHQDKSHQERVNNLQQEHQQKRRSSVVLQRISRLDSMPSLPLTKTVKKGPATLCGHFKASLVELVLKLEQTKPNFIRCIQPNPQQSPNLFDRKHIERQLRYTGVLQTVKIRQQGYAVRLRFSEFLQRYRIIHYEMTEQLSDLRSACGEILLHVTCTQGDWQLGINKVFMRYNVVAQLLRMLEFHHGYGDL